MALNETAPESPDLAAPTRSILPAGGWTAVAHEIGAGLTVACVALPICISSGVLAYSPLGPEYAAQGALAGLTCAVFGGIVAAILRTSSFVTNIPTNPIGFLHASFGAALMGAWKGDPALVLAAYPVFVLLVAFWQILFGISGLSRVIKFTPYPVLGGFVTGLGLLIGLKQLPVLFGVASLSDLLGLAKGLSLPHPLTTSFGLLSVLAVMVVGRIFPKFPALLSGLLIGFIGYHLLRLVIPGLDLGPTIGAVSIGSFGAMPKLDLAIFAALWNDAEALRIIVLSSLILALLGTLDLFLDLRAAQNLSDIPIGPRRELIGLGAGNIVASIVGAVVVAISYSVTVANHRAGGRSRISTISAAVMLAGAVFLAPSVLFAIPMIVLASLLIIVSIRSFDAMTLRIARDAFVADDPASRNRARRNLAIIIAVAAATVFGQPLIGAGVGLLLACFIFIADMSRPIVRRRTSGAQVHSKRVRSRHDLDVLKTAGPLVSVLELQGVLFFGNSDDLVTELRAIANRAVIIILDFKRVSDIDVSGATALQQAAKRCLERNRQLIVCSVRPGYANIVSDAIADNDNAFILDDVDAAMEWAEEAILRAGTGGHSVFQQDLAQADLTLGMPPADIDILKRHLTAISYPAGTALCHAGDPSDRLWILTRGTVSIRVSGPTGDRRLASLAPGCSVGEMGLLEHQPRSADVVADDDVEAFMLTGLQFEALLRDHPRVGQAILTNIARQLAQRLRVTSEDLRLADS
ncbi:MAG: SulP family inorganic anion transporter [Pseudorhodoplanes sp.]|jgi:MFS superfamily sulfate permease-like transporter|nr:SulP family inorganic anion transporter [Pseudorhodoplanes sp.]